MRRDSLGRALYPGLRARYPFFRRGGSQAAETQGLGIQSLHGLRAGHHGFFHGQGFQDLVLDAARNAQGCHDPMGMGVDHLIYGWLFFGLVMFLLFWIGSFFRESPAQEDARPEFASVPDNRPRQPIEFMPIGILVFLALIPRWHVAHLERLSRSSGTPSSFALTVPPSWSWVTLESGHWTPHYTGERIKLEGAYASTQGLPPVTLFIAYYRQQAQGSSLITSGNTLVIPQDHHWGKIHESAHPLSVSAQTAPLPFTETLIRSEGQRRIVWSCHWVDRHWVSSPYAVKAWEAWSVLKGQGDGAAIVVFSTPIRADDTLQAQRNLQSFSQAMIPEIQRALEPLNPPHPL